MAISLNAAAAQLLVPTDPGLDALALRSGQTIEARVVSSGQGGTPRIVIANQSIELSAALKLQEGALVRLLVQGTGPNVRLTVLPTQVPAQATPQSSAPPAAAPPSQTAQQPLQQQSAKARPVPPSGSQQPPVRSGAAPSSGAPGHAQSAQARLATVSPTAPSAQPAQRGPASAVPQQPVAAAPQPSAVVQPGGSASPQAVAAGTLEPGTVLRIDRQLSGGRILPVLVPDAAAGATRAGNQQGATPAQALQSASVTPLQQAIHQTVQGAVVRQDSVTSLLTTLAGLGAKLANLPKPVAQAGSDLLGARVQLDGKPLDGAALKRAFNRSGVLYESSLLKSTGQAPPKGDIKANLLNLRGALRTWLGSDAEPKLPPANRPPPPTPGAPPRAERPGPALAQNLPPNTDTGARLLGQTEAALARTRLTQISSLPEGMMRAGQAVGGPAELNIELPLMFGGEMSVGQFQILRDGAHGSDSEQDDEWKMRFSIHFTQTGEVGATVSLRGGKTHVMLWAERDETADALNDSLGELEQALDARGLNPGTLKCRSGHPPQADKPVGAFMDNCS